MTGLKHQGRTVLTLCGLLIVCGCYAVAMEEPPGDWYPRPDGAGIIPKSDDFRTAIGLSFNF